MELAQAIAASPDARRHQLRVDGAAAAAAGQDRPGRGAAPGLELGRASPTVLNTAISGTTVTQIRDDIYLVNVVARQAGGQTLSVETLRTLQLPLPNGRSVPLTQIATFDYTQEYPLVWRRDREPVLTVQADVAPGVLPDSRDRRGQAGDRRAFGEAACRLPDRARRHRRGERPFERFGLRCRAVHAADHADRADVPAEELSAARHRAERGAAGADRRRAGAAASRASPWALSRSSASWR